MVNSRRLPITLALVLAMVIGMGVLWSGNAHAQVVCSTATQWVWDGDAATNSWTDGANWDNDAFPNTVPGIGDGVDADVCIADQTPDLTVTHSTGTHNINSIESDEAFQISGGTLNIAAASQIVNDFTLSGGSTLGGAGDAGHQRGHHVDSELDLYNHGGLRNHQRQRWLDHQRHPRQGP